MNEPRIPTNSALAQLDREQFDPLAAVGGIRGIIESVCPGLLFVVVYVASSALMPALIAAGVLCGLLIMIRLVTRQNLTYSLSGLIGVTVGIGWALFTGRGRDFFTLGLISAAGYAALIATSILLRYPLVSAALAPLWSLPWKWWRLSEYRQLARTCRRLTWLWFALFALRLAVQLPLWWWDQVAWLGTVKLLLGVPPFVVVAWITWMVLRGYHRQFASSQPPTELPHSA